MKKAFLTLIVVLLIVGCSGTEKVVKPDKVYKDQPEISCMQEALRDHMVFQEQFKLDMNIPELTVYAKGEYAYLTDEEQDNYLASIGMEWQSCYKDDFRPLTLWLKDKNDMIITVIFVTKD